MDRERDFAADPLLNTSWLLGLGVVMAAGMSGALIGLIVSVLARSERAAVALLPLAILPQVLLSRVSYGNGREDWTEPSPYGPIVDTTQYFRRAEPDPPNRLMLVLSLPLPSRPATAVLDMPVHPMPGLSRGWPRNGSTWPWSSCLTCSCSTCSSGGSKRGGRR